MPLTDDLGFFDYAHLPSLSTLWRTRGSRKTPSEIAWEIVSSHDGFTASELCL